MKLVHFDLTRVLSGNCREHCTQPNLDLAGFCKHIIK